ncbi:MAG: segregation/condensation protein A [Lachnospiraceae bacterium]|nr:segregation/condensation protein A [Lachnospiraceae bacterium]
METIEVKLESFEGPLDLLLHLIDKNKVDIYDIPISLITGQYMEYLDQMEEEDLSKMSDFVVMASTLLDIKCKMLLPKEVDEQGDEIDPRSELVQKLLEYKVYKYMSYELKDMHMDAGHYLFKTSTMPKEILDMKPPVNYEKLLADTTLSKLNDIFKELMKRQENKFDPIRSKFGKIEKEEINTEEKMSYIRNYAYSHKSFSFRALLEKSDSRQEIIVTFLIILEMMKTGEFTVTQEDNDSDIIIKVNQVA